MMRKLARERRAAAHTELHGPLQAEIQAVFSALEEDGTEISFGELYRRLKKAHSNALTRRSLYLATYRLVLQGRIKRRFSTTSTAYYSHAPTTALH